MVKENKEPKPKKATIEDVLLAIGEITTLIKEKVEHPLIVTSGESVKVTEAPIVRTQPSGLPIPTEYVELMETILNKKFDMQISYMADTASFELAILVPLEYSNAGKPHWDTFHEDRRSKVIENALGVTGVREWITQIYENFGPETKSKIAFERSQV